MPMISLNDYKKAYRDIRKEEEIKGFYIHLVVYVFINTMLIIINLLYSPNALWFFYPLLCWGIGITIHYLSVSLWLDKKLKDMEAKAEYRARKN